MSELFTYGSIGTLAGAAAATALVVQALKGLGVLASVSSRLLAYLTAIVLLALDALATGPIAWQQVPLILLNGLLVASSAMGTWQVTTSLVARLRAAPAPPLGRGP